MSSVGDLKPVRDAGDPHTAALRRRQLIGRARESAAVKAGVISTQ
jgi:hypothetical protein